jgi:hypothetical protein
MNCADVRVHLPGLLYGDLRPEEKAALEKHLAECPACRREYTAFQGVRQLLEIVPTPAVQIDLPRLYREAADRQARRAQRWRRVALWVSSAAALLVAAALGLRLEVRLEAHQVVLRWGAVPERESTAPSSHPQALPAPPFHTETSLAHVTPEQLQLVTALIHALADNVQTLERRQQKEEKQIHKELQQLKQESTQRWTAFERTVNALYLMSQKGE